MPMTNVRPLPLFALQFYRIRKKEAIWAAIALIPPNQQAENFCNFSQFSQEERYQL